MPSCGFVFCLNNQSMPTVRCLLTLVLVSLILLPVILIQLSGEEHLRNWGLQARTLCSTLPCCGRGREGDSDRSASSGCTKVYSPFCINTCFSRSFFVCEHVCMWVCAHVWVCICSCAEISEVTLLAQQYSLWQVLNRARSC